MGTDMTFCVNPDCPYHKICDQSAKRLKGKRGVYSFANLGGICRKYVYHLVEQTEKGKERMMKECR